MRTYWKGKKTENRNSEKRKQVRQIVLNGDTHVCKVDRITNIISTIISVKHDATHSILLVH